MSNLVSPMETSRSVGLFVTCLVDMFRPSVAFSTIRLLEKAGCDVSVPSAQVCCGQPAYNSGEKEKAITMAKQLITQFEAFDYVVLPSGSCAGTIVKHYPAMFSKEDKWHKRAVSLSDKTYELTSFLVDVCQFQDINSTFDKSLTYHDSCGGLRELNVKGQPRKLLTQVDGVELKEHSKAEVCCGFGGTFCMKYSEVSDSMVSKKTSDINEVEPDALVGGDLGCLMNLAGKLKREGSSIEVRHIAEVLDSDRDPLSIAEGQK